MPLETAGAILGGALRLVAGIVGNVVLELLIKGPGYLILRLGRQRDRDDPGDAASAIAGLLFWIAVAAAAALIYNLLGPPAA